ncbi:MAG: T9SS type A sorting domain-containing protein, partial [Candidatus Saccharibacteria bacterium]
EKTGYIVGEDGTILTLKGLGTGINAVTSGGATFFPNPVNRILNIGMQDCNRMIIFDSKGKMVMDTPSVFNQVDVGHLKPGIYILQIRGKEGVTSQKFVKQ